MKEAKLLAFASILFLCLTPACKTLDAAVQKVEDTKALYQQGRKTAEDVKKECEDAADLVNGAGKSLNISSDDVDCPDEYKELVECCENFGADMGGIGKSCDAGSDLEISLENHFSAEF